MTSSGFEGFNSRTYNFFSRLAKNNSKAFFDKNRKIYDDDIVTPAKMFVTEIGEFFQHLSPDIRTEPKFNITLMRMNNDMRFSKGDPYRTYFLIHFGRFKMDSEFYVYLDKAGVSIGLFINQSKGENFFFRKNMKEHQDDFISLCKRNKLDGKFTLSKIAKVPEVAVQKFHSAKHLDMLTSLQYVLLEKQYPLSGRICTSASLLTEAVKVFSLLFPIYCFSVSDSPIRMIEQFENRLGIPS